MGGQDGGQQPSWGGSVEVCPVGVDVGCMWVWVTVSDTRTSRSSWNLERRNRKGTSLLHLKAWLS